MSYDNYESSVEGGQPIELYQFAIGIEDYYYTSAEDTVVYGGNSHLSRQIERNSPDQSTEEGRGKLEMTLLADDPVCSRFVGIVPPLPLTVRILRFHRGDLLDGRVVWNGRVVSASFIRNATLCKMTAIASEAVLSRQIPAYKYQGLCNHRLYDANCGVAAAAFSFAGFASSVSGVQLTVSGLTASKGNGWATGGKIIIGSDVRLISLQDNDVLTLSLPFASDPTGQGVDVYAGCDHTTATCIAKFANIINHGGFPHVPTKNPFESGV